jgi:arylsulfatase A-like enzyme/Flp pilus assembly protein TadD
MDCVLRGRAPRIVAFAALVAFGAAGIAVWIRGRTPASLRREAGLDVLLITIDTLRSDALGVYGQPLSTSPWIDRLSRAAVRFETAHAHNVMTLPSHANILSGRHPFEHGVRDNAGFRFPERLDTLATILKRHGYRTAAFVSSFTLDSRFGLDRGFDVYEDSFVARQAATVPSIPERPADATVALAGEWLREPGERPRFAWVHFYDPHAPYQPPEPYASTFRADPYLGEVATTDAALRTLVEPLLAAGRRGRTLLVLTADHGEALGEHGERAHGLFGYEATLRVPLVLYAPRLFDPRVVREPVRHLDLAPTILDALGLAVPAEWPGRSLLGLASGRRAPAAPSYFEALSAMLGRGWAPLYGVVQEGWKYVELPEAELYELPADPRELRNLVASRPDIVERLRARLARFREQDAGPAPREESADTRERLAALGYVTAVLAPPRRQYTEADDPKRLVHLDDMMQQVIARERAGDSEGAVSLCAEVVRQRPDMVSALLVLARLERSRERIDAAIALLERAIAANPEDPSAPAMLASYLGEAGRAAQALRLLDPYLRRAEPPLDVLQAHGTALARLGRSQEALAAFARVRERDPDSPLLLVQMATVHLERGEAARAEPLLEEALRLNPDLGLAHHHLGLLCLAAADAAGAERHLRRALELEPMDVDSQLNLGLLLTRQGRVREARPLLEAFARRAPHSIYGEQIDRVLALLSRPPLAPAPKSR